MNLSNNQYHGLDNPNNLSFHALIYKLKATMSKSELTDFEENVCGTMVKIKENTDNYNAITIINYLNNLSIDLKDDSIKKIMPSQLTPNKLKDFLYSPDFNITLQWLDRLFTIPCIVLSSKDVYEYNTYTDIIEYYISIEQKAHTLKIEPVKYIARMIQQELIMNIKVYQKSTRYNKLNTVERLTPSLFINKGEGYFKRSPVANVEKLGKETTIRDFTKTGRRYVTATFQIQLCKNVVGFITQLTENTFIINTNLAPQPGFFIDNIRMHTENQNNMLKPRLQLDSTINIVLNWEFGQTSLTHILYSECFLFDIDVFHEF